jgi:spermidine synthase
LGCRASDRDIRIGDDEGRRALLVDGVIVSVAVDGIEPPSGYWAAMLPEGSPRSALLLGLGGGTLAQLLANRYPNIEIVGVDYDSELVQFARDQFGLDLPNLEIVIDDAFEYVERCDRSFDYVAVDLFAGYDFQRGVLAKPFLRRIREVVGQGGEVAFNLFEDRRTDRALNRIGRILRQRRVEKVGKNVVAHYRGS